MPINIHSKILFFPHFPLFIKVLFSLFKKLLNYENVPTCVTTTTIACRPFPSPRKALSCLSAAYPYPYPQALAPAHLISSSAFSRMETPQHSPLCLAPFTQHSASAIHPRCCVQAVPPLLLQSTVPLSCFQFLIIMNKDPTNTWIHVSAWAFCVFTSFG